MKIKPDKKAGGVIMELGAKEVQLPFRPEEELPAVLPGFNLKKILVPVDFSECMNEALLYAVKFAKQFDAELTLLHVATPYSPGFDVNSPSYVETVEDAEEALKKLRDRLANTVACQYMVCRGAIDSEIIAVANLQHSDLIILAMHGRTGLTRLLMGSTTERVVRHAGCPLLIVRPNEHEFVNPDKQKKAET